MPDDLTKKQSLGRRGEREEEMRAEREALFTKEPERPTLDYSTP